MATPKLPTLTLTKGLPGSGKSTWAKGQVTAGNAVRVNRDDLRNMLHGGKYSKKNEQQVTVTQFAAIDFILKSGQNVIVDDTNLNPNTEGRLREHFGNRANIVIKDFTDVPIATCVERDSKREGNACVGPEVITRMYEQYRPMTAKVDKTLEESIIALNRPDAVMVDIDGTLAHHDKKRSPFDWKQVINDRPDQTIISLVRHLDSSHYIIIMSGRDSVCRPETEAWLEKWNVPYNVLLMRAEGDTRKDSIIKEELYNAHVRNKYDVKFVLDDRNQVVDMWRLNGLKCLQCEPGAF